MRYLVIAAAFLCLPAAFPAEADAAGPGQGIQIVNNNYIINQNENVVSRRHHGYGCDRYDPPRYRSYGKHRRRTRGFESHDEAVARIRATHSRFRTYYHPRSFYNSPPHYYDWRGW